MLSYRRHNILHVWKKQVINNIVFSFTLLIRWNRILRKGQQKLHLYPGVEGDGAHPTSPPGKLPKAKEVDRVEKVYFLFS